MPNLKLTQSPVAPLAEITEKEALGRYNIVKCSQIASIGKPKCQRTAPNSGIYNYIFDVRTEFGFQFIVCFPGIARELLHDAELMVHRVRQGFCDIVAKGEVDFVCIGRGKIETA